VDVEFARRLDGDVLIVGAGGKMGPSLPRRVHRALARVGSRHRVLAASRFSSAEARGRLEADDIQTLACDLLEPAQIAALPRAENVLFLAGRKFGTLNRTDLTWITKDKRVRGRRTSLALSRSSNRENGTLDFLQHRTVGRKLSVPICRL